MGILYPHANHYSPNPAVYNAQADHYAQVEHY